MYHVPMCPVCNENEVGSLPGGSEYYCSHVCENIANAEGEEFLAAGEVPISDEMVEEFRVQYYGDGEPEGSHDLSDDGDALASAGFGTDEDYGYYGDDF